MATFKVNETRVTEEPFIIVETAPRAGPAPPAREVTLLPGRHRFQLVVQDDQGNQSRPAIAEVVVLRA